MGAWIEITWRCGVARPWFVVPFMGAWIEIVNISIRMVSRIRRSLHGSVD